MSSENGQPDLKVFDTGAVRSTDAEAVDYTLISPIALRALAETCAYGAKKYKPYNAEMGMGARDLLNHALKHIYDFLEGRRDEEDLSHAMWNVGMAIHSLQAWPHLNHDLRRSVDGVACIPPTVDDATARSWRRCGDQLKEMKKELKEAESTHSMCFRCHQMIGCGDGGDGLDRGYSCEVDKIKEQMRIHENVLRMKRDVRDAAAKRARIAEDIHCGDCVVADDGGAIVKLPGAGARVPTRYHIMPMFRLECQAPEYRDELKAAGHVVVSRWIGLGPVKMIDPTYTEDLQACDVAIVFMGDVGGEYRVDEARRYGKSIVLIGGPIPDFPRHGQPERWFRDWSEFLASLETPACTPSSR